MNFQYNWYPGNMAIDELLNECANLYSNHYGKWSDKSKISPGENIRLSLNRIQLWTASEYSWLATARLNNELIGYAIAIKIKLKKYGIISWVTQLVVHEKYRKMDVGKTLLFSIWGFSNHFAWGLISANPYAIRALEKATRRRCNSNRIAKNKKKLIRVGIENLPYVSEKTSYEINKSISKINTEFFVSHSTLHEMLSNVTSDESPWILGSIDEGWEWFAFTFQDQEQIGLTSIEIDKMLAVSDEVTKQAYSRMTLDSSHSWASHTLEEKLFIISNCGLSKENTILDFGCGTGRHSIELSKLGFLVTGVDYLESSIKIATDEMMKSNLSNIEFIVDDCRYVKLNQKFDVVLCLYDVIGTYAESIENNMILKNIVNHLKPGGRVLISVLNFELTNYVGKNYFSLKTEPEQLLNLPANNIMEKTGDIFNPDYFLIETDSRVIYRKEQFESGNKLPVELIVRDRRYDKEEIEKMCTDVGLEIIWTRYIRSGKWDEPLKNTDINAKEILILCTLST